jgi:tRNA(fMet)-specific endonuclease VapC
MESAHLGVILDSSVLIEAERQRLDLPQFLERVTAEVGVCEVAICAISVAELAHGIQRADTLERRHKRRVFLDRLKIAVPVYPITAETAELVGKIDGESEQRGITIPFDDLLIGVCALERGYAIITRNRRHFELIPGLHVVDL